MQTSQEIKDGFAEIFNFHEHKSQLKGLQMIDADYDQAKAILYGSSKDILMFYSWDNKNILLWQYNNCSDEEFISSGIMDRGPTVINKLKFPQDGYIPSIVYISKLKLFLAAALDMTFRLYDRKFNLIEVIKHEERVILTLEYDVELNLIIAAGACGITIWKLYRNASTHLSHCIEKVFTFSGIGNDWASKIIFEPKFDNIYLLGDTSVTVLGFRRRRIVAKLENIHECPVTKACWYPRSQFYLTSCTQGLVKCWTNHFSSESPTKKRQDNSDDVTTKFALLHTYYAHSGPVTGLCLHEVSGLAISTGMDNMVKVLNLEALYILYSFDFGGSVTFFRTTYFGGKMGCLFASNEGLIKYWKPSACGTFYGVVSSDVYSIVINEEMKYEHNYLSSLPVTSIKSGVSFSIQKENPVPQNWNITVIGDHDVRVCGEKGNVISILDAAVIADGIKSICVSVYQQFLFVLTGNGALGVYCLRTLACPLIYTVPLKDLNIDGANVITLINYSPTFKKKASADGHLKTSIRNEMIPLNINEILVIGTDNSLLYFLDTLDGFSNIYAHSLSQGCVTELKYLSQNQSLLVMFYDVNSVLVNFIMFQMPEMQVMHELSNITKYSCTNYNCVMNLLGIGYTDGTVCIYSLLHGLVNPVEIEQQSHSHDAAVASISFCDKLRIFASGSFDGTIFIWDVTKILIRIIRFNSPVKCVCFGITPPFGGLIVNQNKYILIVKRDKWDEGGFLQATRDNADPWAQEGWIKGKGVLTKAEEELLGIAGTEKQILAEIFDETKEQSTHVETSILPSKTVFKTTTKTEIDAFYLADDYSNAAIATSQLGYHDRLQAIGAPLNVTRPRCRVNEKPSVTIKIKDAAVQNKEEIKELRAVSPIRIPSHELYLFGPRPPELSNKPSSMNAARPVVISPRVDEEYLKSRAVTYGLVAGTVQETPTIILDKKTGEAKLALPSSFGTNESKTSDSKSVEHKQINRLDKDEAMKALHQFRFFDSLGKQIPNTKPVPPPKSKVANVTDAALNDLFSASRASPRGSSKKGLGRRNSMINDPDLVKKSNKVKNKLIPEDNSFVRNKDRGTMLTKKQHKHAIKESHNN